MSAARRHAGSLIAFAIVLGWLVIGGVTGPFAGRLSEVATNDNTAFLPADAEATRAQELSTEFADVQAAPAFVVYTRAGGITDADRQQVAAQSARFAEVPGVIPPVSPPLPSEDGQALQVIVQVSQADSTETGDTIGELRRIAGEQTDGMTVHVAGPAGLQSDLVEVFGQIDGPLLLVTLCVVLVILLIVYRSPSLWIIPLLSAIVSYALAAFFVYLLADAGAVTLNGQAQGILTVLVFGAGTDYALLLIARYREELHLRDTPTQAVRAAWKGTAPAIIASGGTTIASLLCLLLSSLNSNRSTGPVAAIGIACTLIVMLTLLPALLLLGGRWAFWPRVPHPDRAQPEQAHSLWARIARGVGKRARPVWIGTTVGLGVLVVGLTQLGATTLGQSDLFTERTDSVAGQELLARHYPGGQGSPATIFTTENTAEEVTRAAAGVPGVVDVRPAGSTGGQQQPAPAPQVVGGRVELAATFADLPDSDAAEQTLRRLREAVHAVPGSDAVVGGFTATNVDTADASTRDRNLIIPVVLAVILVILTLLLRAVVAPILLILTVVLSYGATLGVCAVLFRYVFGFAGVDTSFPLFAFVFLVALGIDYNIFLMTRVREESVKRGTRAGVLQGLVVTGGVITSAGIVLAATFSALAVLPLVVLVELGVAVAIGVLIDTIVVRSLLVPALAYDIGPKVWWPSALSRQRAAVSYRPRHSR